MSRQHARPVLVPNDGSAAVALSPLGLGHDGHGWSEAAVQALVQSHPACLPIEEVDPLFRDPVPICTELSTIAGPIDNLLVTASGLPVLVECKLWRNPQARREVVGQILDYAKELSRWSSSDLQREVRRRLGREGDPVLDLVRAAGHRVEEIAFNDALTLNLRRGRFLLLIVGDGIREGVEAIAEYLQTHAGLHFTLGLVEMPIHRLPDGASLVSPRVLARTALITREVVAAPPGYVLADAPEETGDAAEEEASDADTISRRPFMREMVRGLALDDPDQRLPTVTPGGWLYIYLPAPANSCWISVLDRRGSRPRVGVRLTSRGGTVGEAALRTIAREWAIIRSELDPDVELDDMGDGRFRIQQFLPIDRERDEDSAARAAAWLRSHVNVFVNVFRPRVEAAVADLGG